VSLADLVPIIQTVRSERRMSLLHIPAPIFSGPSRIAMPLGEWPEATPLTPAQIAQRQAARKAQVGKSKAANRIKR
jgi:hypothetical protein